VNDAKTSSLPQSLIPVAIADRSPAPARRRSPRIRPRNFPNAFGTSYFEQGRERLTYSAAAQWKPVPELTIGVDYLRIDATYDNLNQSMYAFPGNTWNSAGR
jgi:iron complex outermembrane receptor protein